MDYQSILLDEIALEGLDGITISALWVRLNNRQPSFPLTLDDATKSYLWEVVLQEPELDFYVLPQPRLPLVITDRFKNTDSETGIVLEAAEHPPDIYPICIVKDGNIMGSCATYKTRKKVTSSVREEQLGLTAVLERWGEKLVIVASQDLRNYALYGDELAPSIQLPDRQFVLLERVGRSRYHGEVTQGVCSLKVMKDSPKTLFYVRKMLIKYKLITLQPFSMKLVRGQNTSGKLIHLKRFFVLQKPQYQGWLEKLTEKLQGKPNQREMLTDIRAEMGIPEKTFKKLYQTGAQYVKTELLPYQEVHPEGPEEHFYVKNRSAIRYVRVISLIKPYKYSVDVDHCVAEEEEEADEDDEEDISEAKVEKLYEENAVEYKPVMEIPLLRQTYSFICMHKERGVIQRQVMKAFNIGKLDSRQLCRNLQRMGVVKKIMMDVGKQRVQVYVANDWVPSSKIHKDLIEEKKLSKSILESSFTTKDDGDTTATPGTSKQFSPAKSGDDTVELFEDSSDVLYETSHGRKRKSAHVTYRMLKRANIVLKAVKEAKLVDNIFHVQKKIIDEEAAEGVQGKLDKKSLMRIIYRLAKQGSIKSIKTLIKFGNEEKELHFLTDSDINADDQIVKSAIEAAKLKALSLSKEMTRDLIKDANKAQSKDPNRPNYALLTSHTKIEDMQYDPDAGKHYGYLPRMRRIQLIHELLWYLVYGYDGQVIKDEEEEKESQDTAWPNVVKYQQELSWKRFIPPLPKHQGQKEGWFLVGDVLLIIPVQMFVQVNRVNFRIPGLVEVLNHPEKKYTPLSQLPTTMRHQLMAERKFIFCICEIFQHMALMGLLSFGNREFKDKSQTFAFLHRRCKVVNTSIPDLPILDAPVKEYVLDSENALVDYWFTLQWVCLNTPLATLEHGLALTKGDDSLMKSPTKPERFHECLRGKRADEIEDNAVIPGNGLGAGGLDALLFTHLRRNWSTDKDDVKIESLVGSVRKKQSATIKSTYAPKSRAKSAPKTPGTEYPGANPVKKRSSLKKKKVPTATLR